MILIKSAAVPAYGAIASSIGGRAENQDDFCCLDTRMGFLVVVCDGMGGGPGGKTASNIVKHEIARALAAAADSAEPAHVFKMAAAKAQESLIVRMQESPALNGMGSTFVALLIGKDAAFVAHAGDSRCYLFRGRKCIFRTSDHSLVAELVKTKALTEEEARISPQANVITRGLGAISNNVPEIDKVTFRKGDRFVLCTDGIWGMMQSKNLSRILSDEAAPEIIVRKLDAEIDRIGRAAGSHHDNHTLAVVDVNFDSAAKATTDFRKLLKYGAIAVAVVATLVGGIFLGVRYFSSKKSSGGSPRNVTEVVSGSHHESDGARAGEDVADSSAIKPIPMDSLRKMIRDRERDKNKGEGDAGKEGEGVSSGKEKNTGKSADEKKIPPVTIPDVDKIIAGLEDLLKFSAKEIDGEKKALDLRNTKVGSIHDEASILLKSIDKGKQPKLYEAVERVARGTSNPDTFSIDKAKNGIYSLTKNAKKVTNNLLDILKNNTDKQ